jgi:hypothetical protein
MRRRRSKNPWIVSGSATLATTDGGRRIASPWNAKNQQHQRRRQGSDG